MRSIEVTRQADIETALEHGSRQYLTGILTKPQALRSLPDTELEVGISTYPQTKIDAAHMHPLAREYQYVISGHLQIMDLHSEEVVDLYAGDFYVIERGTPYAQKVAEGTRVLFFKNPGGNDKILVDLTPRQEAWLSKQIDSVR